MVHHRHSPILYVLALLMALGACLPAARQQPPAVPTAPTMPTSAATPVASPVPVSLESEGTDLAEKGVVSAADGGLQVLGKARLLLSLRHAANPPAAPAGWVLVAPVYDVLAQDAQRRAISKLAERLTLRFAVPGDQPATVLVYDGAAWQVVPSDVDADGQVSAEVDHLTPYTVARPARNTNGALPTPKVTLPAVTWTPGARATKSITQEPASAAATALAAAIKPLKNKTVKVSAASGYNGSLYVAVPAALQNALGAAIGAGGTGYYGLYNAVNEAVTVNAAAAKANGVLTLLVEPKTSMPASAGEAQSQVSALFPGVTGSLAAAPVPTGVSGYCFYGGSGNTAYALGYVSYQGVPFAYCLTGSGSYQAFVPK